MIRKKIAKLYALTLLGTSIFTKKEDYVPSDTYTPEKRPDPIPDGLLDGDFNFTEQVIFDPGIGNTTIYRPLPPEECLKENSKAPRNCGNLASLFFEKAGATPQKNFEYYTNSPEEEDLLVALNQKQLEKTLGIIDSALDWELCRRY